MCPRPDECVCLQEEKGSDEEEDEDEKKPPISADINKDGSKDNSK